MGERVQYFDDLTGQTLPPDADARIQFGWMGDPYEIDLSEENQDAFEAAIQPYLLAARKVVQAPKVPTTVARPRGRRPAAPAPVDIGDVPRGDRTINKLARAWAQSTGMIPTDSNRGRLPGHILPSYWSVVEAGDMPEQFMPPAEEDRPAPRKTPPVSNQPPEWEADTTTEEPAEEEEAPPEDDDPDMPDEEETDEPDNAPEPPSAHTHTAKVRSVPKVASPFGEDDPVPVTPAPTAPRKRTTKRGVAQSA